MKFSGFKRILKEDLAKHGELPAWIDTLLSPINLLIENVGQALQNRLNFEDNFYSKQVTLKFQSGVALEINPTTPYASSARAYGVLLLSTNGIELAGPILWSNKSSGNAEVTITFASATEADCTLLILLR